MKMKLVLALATLAAATATAAPAQFYGSDSFTDARTGYVVRVYSMAARCASPAHTPRAARPSRSPCRRPAMSPASGTAAASIS